MSVFLDVGVGCVVLACLLCMWGHWLDIKALRADLDEAVGDVRKMKVKVDVLFDHHKRVGGNGGTGPSTELQKSG